MGKFKAPKPKKSEKVKSATKALPCLFLILAIFALLMLLFYAVLKSGS
jgi:hypothetical protein